MTESLDTPTPPESDHEVPADLVELYEVLEWERAVAGQADDA